MLCILLASITVTLLLFNLLLQCYAHFKLLESVNSFICQTAILADDVNIFDINPQTTLELPVTSQMRGDGLGTIAFEQKVYATYLMHGSNACHFQDKTF